MQQRTLLISILALLMVAALVGCNLPGVNAVTPPPADTEAPLVVTATPEPVTEAPAATPVPDATEAPAEPEGPNFDAASVYAVSHLDGSRLLVTIQIPGGVSGGYQATVAGSTLNCEILPAYPDRLYCSGPEPFQNFGGSETATVTVVDTASGNTVFQQQFNIPVRYTPTPSHTPTYTYTPTITYTPSSTPTYTPTP